MVLSKKAILNAIEQGNLKITPFDEKSIEASHINLHLSGEEISGEILLDPKKFVMARTVEEITLDGTICGLMEGRSKLAQNGISVEQSSTFVEPGTHNSLVLEIFNASDETIALNAGDKIAKLILMRVVE